MLWGAEFVIGELRELRLKLENADLSIDEIEGSILIEEIVAWVDEYSKLDPRFHPYALQFGAAAGRIRAAARQLERGNRARAKQFVLSALDLLKPRDWFDRAA